MKKLLPILFLGVFFFTNIYAQDKTSDLKTLFKVMKSDEMTNALIDNMVYGMKEEISKEIQAADANDKFSSYIDFMVQEAKELSNTLINKEMLDIYDKVFTHEEIKDMIQFYESPTGKKMLEKTPEISSLLMNSLATKHLPELRKKADEKLKELK